MGPYVEGLRSRVGSRCLLLPGVRAILVDERGDVLLQLRTDLGRWGLPSGSVELEETAGQALRREVHEETGLDVLEAEPMALYSGPSQRFRYPNGDEIQGFSIAFVVRKWNGTPRPDGEEASQVRFWPLDALPEDMVEIHRNTLADYRDYRGRFFVANGPRAGGEADGT